MAGGKRKTRQELAAERAYILEHLSNEEIALFRKRKEYVSLQHSWREFFGSLEPELCKEFLLAILDYDIDGKLPNFANPLHDTIFNSLIKPVIDKLFNEWCLTCHYNYNKGSEGGKITAIRKRAVEMLIEELKTDNCNGVKFADLIKFDKAEGWQVLAERIPEQDYQKLFRKVKAAYAKAETEYNENNNDDD